MSTPTAAPNDLRDRVASVFEGARDLRRELHTMPEVCYEETRTSARIVEELNAIGVEHAAGLAGGTGVIAHLPATTGTHDASVGLRADIDALPIHENTGVAWASQTPGRMHACGHDGHTAILLTAARVLAGLDHRPNPVTFVFQPAEEGGAGARAMMEDGAIDGSRLGPRISRMFGLHGWPELPVGVLATKPGPLLASTDQFEITVRGRGGHAAYPHMCADPVVAAAHVTTAIQTIVSRAVSPIDAAVVTVASIHAGTAFNIIPDEAKMLGTIRTLSDETRQLARRRLTEAAEGAARAAGCEAQVTLNEGYPVTENDPALTDFFFAQMRSAFGGERVQSVEHATMGGEDFSFYGRDIPAVFFVLGVRPEGAETYPALHQAEFDFNDDAIPAGVEAMCRLALAPAG